MKKLEEIRKRKDIAELIRIAKKESKETELSDGLSDAVRDGWKASTGQKVALAFESVDAIGLFDRAASRPSLLRIQNETLFLIR